MVASSLPLAQQSFGGQRNDEVQAVSSAWYGGRPRPRRHCVRQGPSSPLKGAEPPVFGPCLLWSNGWMDEEATWQENRPQPRPHHITRGRNSPHRQHKPSFSPRRQKLAAAQPSENETMTKLGFIPILAPKLKPKNPVDLYTLQSLMAFQHRTICTNHSL